MKNIILIGLALFTLASCKKGFTDLKPQQSVFTDDVFSSMPTARAAVNGLYSLMQSYSYYGRDAMVIPEVLSDNMTRSVKTGNRYTGMNTMTHTATDVNVSRMWSLMYRVITNSNAIIANEAKLQSIATSLETAEVKQLIGEAYAVRAMAYFDLAKFFSRPLNHTPDGSHLCVPLVLSPITNVSQVVYPKRNTAAEVYAQIDKDIQEALNRLPATGDVIINGAASAAFFKIRLNRWGVLALRTRVSLYKEDWATAVSASTAVINSSRYSLLPFASLFTGFQTVGNAESIFEVANNTTDNPGTDSYAYMCSQQGYGEVLGTRQSMNSRSTGTTLTTFRGLYEAYSSTDARRRFVELGNRNSIGGEVNVPLCLKYTNISNYTENTKVFRLAEMYLCRGEALARIAVQTGDVSSLTNSITDINLIRRTRDTATVSRPLSVAFGTPPTGSITATAYLDTIILERRREFALEGQRLFDLNRTKTNYVKINSAGNGASRLVQYTNTTSSYYYRTILPIPITQIQNNPNMVQNEGF